VLRRLPTTRDANLLVGAATADDAGVYRLRPDCALVQTVDFFTPIVDDPYDYGQIAATNALSDVYAMGGRPVTAMNVLGVPTDKVPPAVIRRILQGGAAKVKEAKCALVGGHTIRNPEPIYGLSVTGVVNPKRMITNANARAGDLLVLTKPLGTGIATTAIKREMATAQLARRVTGLMKILNSAGAELAEKGLVRAGTDVTGFGLLGHLGSMCRASGVGARLSAGAIPAISRQVLPLVEQGCVPGGTRTNLVAADEITDWGETGEAMRVLMADAQTSGGLLLCVQPRRLAEVAKVLKKHRAPVAAVIGTIVRSRSSRIIVGE
jgi:selenide,water dikinase